MVHKLVTKGLKGLSKNQIDALQFYEYNIDGQTFRNNFLKVGGTERMAEHLWNKFTQHNHSILAVFGYADSKNKRLLTKTIRMGY